MAGDRAAAAEVLRALLPRVRNLVRYLVRGDQDVDDLAQEALIAVARGFASYRGEGRFESWVDRVVARETLGGVKRRRALRAVVAAADPDEMHDQASPGADEYVARRQMVARLDDVPAVQREALVLHHVMGASVPEVAELLGVPAETVRSRLRLGKARMAELLTSMEKR